MRTTTTTATLLPLLLLGALGAAAAAELEVVWTAREETDIFSGAAFAAGGAVAAGRSGKPPATGEVFSAAKGAAAGAWSPPEAADTSLYTQVEAAGGGGVAVFGSHSSPFPAPADRAAAVGPRSTCRVAAAPAAAGAAPKWTYEVRQCFTDLSGGADLLRVSADGSRVALLGAVNGTRGVLELQLHVLDAATGEAVRVFRTPTPAPGGVTIRSVSLSRNGSVAAFTADASLYVVDVAAGALRAPPIDMAYAGQAFMCEMGEFLAFGLGDAFVLQWNGTAGEYQHRQTVLGQGFLLSTGSFGGGALALGWQSNDATRPRVSALAVPSLQPLWQWTGPANERLQIVTSSVRAAGGYVAAATWGDGGNSTSPTVLLFGTAPSAAVEPLASYTTPGSMWQVDLAATPSAVLLAAGGKSVHANERGAGGNVFLLRHAL